MVTLSKKLITIFLTGIFLTVLFSSFVYADDPTPTPTPGSSDNSQQASDLQKKINDLETKVNQLHSQADTLSSQISTMDNQIKLTEYRIADTEQQITDLSLDIDSATKRMTNLETSLGKVTKTLLNRIVATYQMGSAQPMQVLITSNDVSDLVSRANYLRIVQEHDKKLLYDTQQARNDYANQKQIFEDKKKQIEGLKTQLEAYNTQLDQQKASEQKLLTETQGDEENYQRLLSAARAQLAGFSQFAVIQGGATLLSNQTVCDDWGCYYNQRDSQWGATALNGTRYSIASDGCLMTSMAMVYTHYGHKDVTPLTINSNPNNFASYEPAWLLKTIVANGVTASRASSSIDSELSAGRPVIVGISYDGGPLPDHFVVLISGSGGNYNMNDPFTPNGHNIPFSDKYSVGSIREIDKVSI